MREIDITAFATALADGATVIDVREPFEYVTGHVPGARLVPLAQVPTYAPELAKAGRVYVICASGNRSKAAADYLAKAGVDAWSVAGGTSAWAKAGRPLVRGTRAAA
ncbi:MAG TPA: rhodanese-like domain-containing protein [Micromonosporaceae bacterium]